MAYGLDVDARCWVLLQSVETERGRADVVHARQVMQESTRVMAWRLGLVTLDDVPRVAHDAQGRDLKLTELLALPWGDITEAAWQHLAAMNQGWRPPPQ